MFFYCWGNSITFYKEVIMKLLAKAISILLLGVISVLAFPRPGDRAENFTIYNYQEKKDIEIEVQGKVTVLVSGSVS